MSISKEAVKAARLAVERAMRQRTYDRHAADEDVFRESVAHIASATLAAAAPFIQAAALAPVLALHKPVEVSYFDGEDDEFSATCCDHCTISQDDDSLVRWPCPTARAAELEGKS